METHEGQTVDLIGTLYLPASRSIDHFKVVLADGERAIITRDQDHIREALARGVAGERISVRGRIFTGELPEHYGIFGRANTPYLMDTSRLTFLDR